MANGLSTEKPSPVQPMQSHANKLRHCRQQSCHVNAQ